MVVVPERKIVQISLPLMGMIVLSSLCFGQGAHAQEEKEEEAMVVVKEVSGKVSAIRSNFITIVYKKNVEKGIEYEIDFPIDKDVRVVHKKSLSEIKAGDMVIVKYEQEQKEDEVIKDDGSIERIIKIIGRKAKVITFIRATKKGVLSSGF